MIFLNFHVIFSAVNKTKQYSMKKFPLCWPRFKIKYSFKTVLVFFWVVSTKYNSGNMFLDQLPANYNPREIWEKCPSAKINPSSAKLNPRES